MDHSIPHVKDDGLSLVDIARDFLGADRNDQGHYCMFGTICPRCGYANTDLSRVSRIAEEPYCDRCGHYQRLLVEIVRDKDDTLRLCFTPVSEMQWNSISINININKTNTNER